MAFNYDVRQVTHGNRMGFFAAMTVNPETGELAWSTPYEFTGLINTSFETTQNSDVFYADDMEHIRLLGNASTEGTITTYQIREQFAINHLGKKKTSSGALLDTGAKGNFLWAYRMTDTTQFGTNIPVWRIFTNCQASAPTMETETDSDSVTPMEIEIPITCSPNPAVLDEDNNAVTEINWKDVDGEIQTLVDGMFGEAPTTTVQDFLDAALGTGDPGGPTVAPSAPVITNGSDTTNVIINWGAAAEAVTYNVLRSDSGANTFTEIATGLTDLTYTDVTAVAGTSYDYKVVAVNNIGTSPDSNVLTITAPGVIPTPTPPDAPVITDGSDATNVIINWTAVDGADTYNVYREATTVTPLVSIATAVTGLTYTDSTATAGNVYDYAVTAVNADGESAQSNVLTITAPTP